MCELNQSCIPWESHIDCPKNLSFTWLCSNHSFWFSSSFTSSRFPHTFFLPLNIGVVQGLLLIFTAWASSSFQCCGSLTLAGDSSAIVPFVPLSLTLHWHRATYLVAVPGYLMDFSYRDLDWTPDPYPMPAFLSLFTKWQCRSCLQ